MPSVDELPLQEVLQALSSTPKSEAQLRAALATTCARWLMRSGDEEGAIGHLQHALEMVSDLRPAMRLLYRIYQGRNDVRSAVMYLDQEIRATRHPREAAALYRERGQLVEAHFHDLAAAEQCYQAALKATPNDLAVLRAVERVSLARGEVFSLITNLEAQLEVVRDPSLGAGLLHDLALIEARQNGDLALAGDLLLAAVDLAPGHLLLATDLFRLAEAAGDTELMLHALELEAEAREPKRRAMPLARAAMTLREHRERAGALQLLEAAAAAQPQNASLWRSLEELSMAMGRHDVALSACVGRLRALPDDEDPAARAELFHRMGKLALFRLDRSTEGLAAMRKALRLNPAHVPAVEDTGRFLNANGLWAQLLELIKLEISTASAAGLTREELALAHLRAGQLMEEKLGELDGARECYENALASHAAFRPARDRLERVLHQQEDLSALRRYYGQELSRASSAGRRRFLLSILGQLHARDDDPALAIKYLANLLKESPDHLPSLQVLARTLARAGRQRELLKVTEQEIALTESLGRKAKLLHRAGELALTLGERDKARECFSRALDAVDDHQASADMLGAMLREDGDFEGLVELLRKKQLYATDRARQVGLQLEVATLLSTRLDRPAEALEELGRLLDRWPRHLPALHAAESLATRLGEHRTLLNLLDQHVGAVSGPRTRALLLHRAAQLRTLVRDDDGAIRDLVRALELWPQLGVARAELLRLYERLGRSRELQAFAEAGLTSERGADDRRAMALQLAELSPKPVVAIQYLGAVAEARPEDYVTQLRLARSCRQAGRPSREAGALRAASEVFANQLPPDDPHLLALRYRAARAEEAAGNLDQADATYAAILDLSPGDLLARRGRLRIKERRREAGLARSATELEAAASRSKVAAEKAAYLTIAADLHERRQDLPRALKTIDNALLECPPYLPALHARARLLERIGDQQPGADALETLVELGERLKSKKHRAIALCRAGTLALERGTEGEPNPGAWEMFGDALTADPSNDRAFRGLRRTLSRHGTEGAPKDVAKVLQARLDSLREREALSVSALREVARLASELAGPEHAVELLSAGMDLAADDPGVHVDLAQAYARLSRWAEAVQSLESALSRELSPERKAALHFFAGDGYQRAGDLAAAVPHLLAAGQGGFHPRHALTAADRIAAKVGDLPHRVTALQLLVEIGDGPERVTSLRSLARLHQGPLGQPDVAVERMRELLLLRPTDLDVITELWRLLQSLDRNDEATAVLLAGVAHHRAWLRASGLRNPDNDDLYGAPVAGLMHLFSAMREGDGVYLASAVLEIAQPDAITEGLHCNELVTEPWPLPESQEGRPFDGLVGDLPASRAVDLLRDGVFFLGRIPGATAPSPEVTQRALPPNSAVVMVTRALSEAMGVPLPRVFVDPSGDDEVKAYLAGAPCLVVGRRVNSAPFGPTARDAIGRALMRLSTGGDALHHDLGPARLTSVLLALCAGAGVDVGTRPDHDLAYLERLQELLDGSTMNDLVDLAITFADMIDAFDPQQLLETLHVAEDRAGAICAADPRPRLRDLAARGLLHQSRGTAVVGYLLSDDHLTLRHNLGYLTEIATPIRREEESSAP